MRRAARPPAPSRADHASKCGGDARPPPAWPTSPDRRDAQLGHASRRAGESRHRGTVTGARRDASTNPPCRGGRTPGAPPRPPDARPSRPSARREPRAPSTPARYRHHGSNERDPGARGRRRAGHPGARTRCRQTPVRATEGPWVSAAARPWSWVLLVFGGLLLSLTFRRCAVNSRYSTRALRPKLKWRSRVTRHLPRGYVRHDEEDRA